MKITLRKANALQAAINEALKELDLSTEVTINEFEKPEEVLESARLRFNFSFENVNKNYKYSTDIDFNYQSLKDIFEISDYENHFLKNMIKEKK